MGWDEILTEKVEDLRNTFIEFMEHGGTGENCIDVLNEGLGDLGIVSKVVIPSNRLILPNNNELKNIYEQRQPVMAPPGYTTPIRQVLPIQRSFTTPIAQGTPFSPPKRLPKRQRPNKRKTRRSK